MNKKLRAAYELVLEDIDKVTLCKDDDYAIGCYHCACRSLYKALKSFRDLSEV